MLFQVAWLCFVGSITAQQLELPNWENATENVESFCPEHSSVCDKNKQDRGSNYITELLPDTQTHCCVCRCTDDCVHFGNCCEGKNRNVASDVSTKMGAFFPPGTTCTTALHSISYQNFTDLKAKSFLMVKSCNEGFSDQAIQDKCTHASQTELDEIMPVFDVKNNINYANRFCALCNYVETFENWVDTVVCYDMYMLKKRIKRQKLNLRDILMEITSDAECAIWFKPVDKSASRCVLDEDVISTCMFTRSSEECRTLPPNLYMSEGRVYKNAYCADCNDALTRSCMNTKEPWYPQLRLRQLEKLGGGGVSSSSSSSTTTTTATITANPGPEPRRACRIDELFSEVLGTCLQIGCPAFTKLVGNNCEEVDSLPVQPIEIRANIQYSTQLPAPRFSQIREDVSAAIIESLPEIDRDVCSITNTFQTQNQQQHFEVFITIVDPVKMKAVYESLTKGFDKINNDPNSQFRIELEQGHQLTGNIDNASKYPYLYFENTFPGNESCGAENALAFTDRQFCKTVRIPSSLYTTDYTNVTVNDVEITEDDYVTWFSVSSNISHVGICLETFLVRIEQQLPLPVSVAINAHIFHYSYACFVLLITILNNCIIF